jgi:hypothetical protein
MHHNFPSSEIDSKFVIQLSAAKYLLISLNFVNGRAIFEDEHDTVTEKDLEHLLQLLDNKESGDTAWQNLMERTTSNMTYKAWRREPEVCFASGILKREIDAKNLGYYRTYSYCE